MTQKEYYEILQIEETATDEQLDAQYHALRKKYSEDRFLDGEAGNEAAKNLNKLDTAYVEIKALRREKGKNTDGVNAFQEVEALLKNEDLQGAQAKLDAFNERSAEWHYLQSVLFYKKSWMNESKKQLEIAMEMDPSNKKYQTAYGKLNEKIHYESQTGGQNNTYNPSTADTSSAHPELDQMGGNWCSSCMSCCYTYLCVNCLFNLCCGCR